MIFILHAQADRPPVLHLPPIPEKHNFTLLAGAVGAFDGLPLPQTAGKVGGAVLRLTLLQPQPSAFALLADCLRLCRPLLGEHLVGIRYVLAGSDPEPADTGRADPQPADPGAAVAWTVDDREVVTGFRLSPAIATSPLLEPVVADLGERSLTDDRRFTFLAAAFAGA